MTRKKSKGNGTGTVYPRKNNDGKIIGYRGAYHGPDGKRRYVSAKRKGDAERALRQAMSDADRGFMFDAGTLTVKEYLNRWLTDSVEGTVRRSTYVRYQGIVNNHVSPTLGHI